MICGSICSGIGAPEVAWQPFGWRFAFASEIESFPRAVLKHRQPHVPLHGDFTTIQAGDYEPVDLLVGGTPCQSFSVAGLRGGLDDDRGNLALEYLRLADRLRPRWLVFENVPGVLSSNGGRDFGAILGGMVKLGYGFAYRVLDAQYAGVPQRRRRVFVIGYSGDWRSAAAVLFERHSLQGHYAPRREAGKGVAPTISARPTGGGGLGTDFDLDGGLVAPSIRAQAQCEDCAESEEFITHTLRSEGFDASEDGTGRGTPLVPVAFAHQQGGSIDLHMAQGVALSLQRSQGQAIAFDTTQITSPLNRNNPKVGDSCHPLAAGAHAPAIAFSGKDYGADAADQAPTLRAMGHDGSHANGGGQVAVAFQSSQSGVRAVEAHATLDSNNGSRRHNGVVSGSAVRRLTPTECEKLQGFPPEYTLIPWRSGMASDGPRYKALGNSMAVPVVRWLGERIQSVEELLLVSEMESAE